MADEAKTAEKPADDAAKKTAKKTAAKPEQKVLRAGGHVNRLDGHGWVLDKKD